MTTQGWLLAVLIEALIALGMLAWREYVHDRERTELMDRLMARNFDEYAERRSEQPPGRAHSWLRRANERTWAKLPAPEEDEQ